MLGRFSKVAAAQTLIPFIKKLFICQFFFLQLLPAIQQTFPRTSLLGGHKDKLDASAAQLPSILSRAEIKTSKMGGKNLITSTALGCTSSVT